MKVLALPGLDGTGELSLPFIQQAPPEYEARAVSYPRDRTLAMAELAELVNEQLPVEPFLLLGESFSGLVSIRVAANSPQQLRGLVLVATAAKWSRVSAFRLARLTPLFSLKPPAALLRWLAVGHSATPHQVSAVQRAVASVRPQVLAARFLELARADLRPLLATVTVPTLYIQGTEDRLARAAERRSVLSVLPDATYVSVNGPHCLLLARPRELWQHIAAFDVAQCAA